MIISAALRILYVSGLACFRICVGSSQEPGGQAGLSDGSVFLVRRTPSLNDTFVLVVE